MVTEDPDLPFTRSEYAERLDRVCVSLRASGVDVALLTGPDTVAWLTGYRSRWYRQHTATSLPPLHCLVVDAHRGGLFLIDADYHQGLAAATSVVTDFRSVPTTSPSGEPTLTEYVDFLVAQTTALRAQRIGVERWSCVPSPAVASELEAGFIAAGASLTDISLPMRRIRRIKSEAEIALVRRAQSACDAGIEVLVAEATPEMTELEAWGVYSLGMVRAGGEPAALHETVAAGGTVSDIHALSGRRLLGGAALVYPDMASSVYGYHARATRPLSFGPPDPEQQRHAEFAAGMYDVIAAHGHVGAPWSALTGALAEYIADSGLEGSAGGYELGLSVPPADWVGEFVWSIEEPPPGVIEAGFVTNVELIGPVFLVDTVVFRDDGPEFLSRLPRTILEIS